MPPPNAPGGLVCPSADYGGWCSEAAKFFRTGVAPTCPAPPPPPPTSACNGYRCIQSTADAAPNWIATRPGNKPMRRDVEERSNYNGIQCWGPNALARYVLLLMQTNSVSPCGWFPSQEACVAATCSAAGEGPGGEYCSAASIANPTSWCGAAKAAWSS